MPSESPQGESAPASAPYCPTCQGRYEAGTGFCPKDGTPLTVDTKESMVGQVLADRYRVVRKLGEGGMGQVFEVDHVFLEKKFAIKLLRPEITSDKEAVARFHQEARAAAKIGHENIVDIDDFGRLADGSVYLAMEFLSGEALSDRMSREPGLTIPESLEYIHQVCEGLAAAHDKGIIHRDMKPENIFLVPRHSRILCKILDFGIAKVSGADGEQRLTRTGAIFGTPHYMAPEQALGKKLDHRADVYSVGVILYQAVTGSVPFQADSFMGILSQHLTQPPESPRHKAPDRDIPEVIEAIILKAMAKDPAERFQTMAELGGEIEVAAETLGIVIGERSLSFSRSAPLGIAPRTGEQGARPATGSGQPVKTPTPPAGAVGAAAQQASQAMAVAPKKSLMLPIVLGLVALVVGGGIALGVWLLTSTTPRPQPQMVLGANNPQPIVNPPVGTQAAPTGSAPEMIDVLVETTPEKAEVRDAEGRVLGLTPTMVQAPRTGTVSVKLHRDGYLDVTAQLQATGNRKFAYALQHDHKAEPSKTLTAPIGRNDKLGPQKLPAPPPSPPDPPAPVEKKQPAVLDAYGEGKPAKSGLPKVYKPVPPPTNAKKPQLVDPY